LTDKSHYLIFNLIGIAIRDALELFRKQLVDMEKISRGINRLITGSISLCWCFSWSF